MRERALASSVDEEALLLLLFVKEGRGTYVGFMPTSSFEGVPGVGGGARKSKGARWLRERESEEGSGASSCMLALSSSSLYVRSRPAPMPMLIPKLDIGELGLRLGLRGGVDSGDAKGERTAVRAEKPAWTVADSGRALKFALVEAERGLVALPVAVAVGSVTGEGRTREDVRRWAIFNFPKG